MKLSKDIHPFSRKISGRSKSPVQSVMIKNIKSGISVITKEIGKVRTILLKVVLERVDIKLVSKEEVILTWWVIIQNTLQSI